MNNPVGLSVLCGFLLVTAPMFAADVVSQWYPTGGVGT